MPYVYACQFFNLFISLRGMHVSLFVYVFLIQQKSYKKNLITYGIEGKQSDVDLDVFDALFILDNGKINFTVPVINFKPVFFFCKDLIHGNSSHYNFTPL